MVVGAVAVVAQGCGAPAELDAAWEGGLHLDAPSDVRSCRPPRAEMRVSTAWGAEVSEPLVDLDSGRRTTEATYSGHWAERRVLRVEVATDRRSAKFTASFDTDYGPVGGRVRAEDSRAHVHADRVCFDLQVVRLEGRQGSEHWVGALPLDGE